MPLPRASPAPLAACRAARSAARSAGSPGDMGEVVGGQHGRSLPFSMPVVLGPDMLSP